MLIELAEIGGRAVVSNASRQWSERRGVLVRVRHNGIEGTGEVSPLEGHSAETLEDVIRELSAVGDDAVDVLAAGTLSSSARFALETAMLDRDAIEASSSIAERLAGRAVGSVRGSGLLGDPRDANALPSDIEVAKLKVGPAAAWPAQAEAIALLVERHPDISLRLDFNGTLSLQEARSILADIEKRSWPIDYVEDPVSDEHLGDLDTPIDIAVDALVAHSPQRVFELAKAGHAQVAVLKPALLGGLRKTFVLARGLAPTIEPVISHLLDGPIALAAYAELACAITTFVTPSSIVALAPARKLRAAGLGPHAALAAYAGDDSRLANGRWEKGFLHSRREPLAHRP